MKLKLFTLLLAVTASVGTMFAVTIDGLNYNLNDELQTAEVAKYSSASGDIIIPSSVTYNGKTYSVTSIGEQAFYGCSSLTSVTIPNSVKSIGSYAFYECSSLTSVTIPNSVTSIGNGAFYGCDGLTSVTIGNSVTSIGDWAFGYCSSLTSVTIPNSVTSIGDDAFYGCSSLTSVTIPNSVTSIGDFAFDGCSSLTSVTIGNGVTSIGDRAFEGCSSLTSVHITDLAAWCNVDFENSSANPVYYAHKLYLNGELVKDLVIPNSVTSIGDFAFDGCSSLTSITIPNSVTSIGYAAFAGCSSLTSINVDSNNPNYSSLDGVLFNKDKTTLVAYPGGKQGAYTIPNSVTSIGKCAFFYCSSLTSITIPNSVTSIGYAAFAGCSSLTSVIIGNGVTSIGDEAFYGCSNITSVTWNAKNCLDFTSDNTPFHRLWYVNGDYQLILFDIRANISFFVFGEEVEHIPANLCYGMTNLTSIMIDADTPPTLGGSTVFSNTNNCPIYVPCGTLDAYKTAWSAYASRIKYAPINIETKVNNEVAGKVVAPENMCDEMIVTAIPNRGYKFTKWSDGNTDNPRSFVLQEGLSFTAIFDYALSGKCGKDSALTWTLDTTTMALNITGSGALSENYTYAPFIQSLTIGNSVTSIGRNAFGECESLKTVVLGSSVKVLEAAAFAYCSSIETITCYSMRPPTVNQDALYGLDYSTIVYVPADYLNTYKMHDAWGLYDVRPLGATSAETEDVKITPSENEANVTWPSVNGAATYELVIKDKDGNIVCTLIFNANGQLTSIAFNAPSRNGVPAQTQNAGFSFTITGLDSGTGYDLTLTAKDNSGNIIEETTIPFQTNKPEGIENVQANEVQSTKVIKDGQVLILRNGKTYTMQGQEVK